MNILGIDPGLASVGWCLFGTDLRIVHDIGCITTKKMSKVHAVDLELRTGAITRRLHELANGKFKVHQVSMEAPLFFGPRARDLGVVWGGIITELRGFPIDHVTPASIRQHFLGKRSGAKHEYQKLLLKKYKLTRKKVGGGSEHALDSLAVAETSAVRLGLINERIQYTLPPASE